MRVIAWVASTALLFSCERSPEDSGKLGTFEVVATMLRNTCGPQAESNAQGAYSVDLFVQGASLRWRPTGGVEATGDYDTRTGAFRIQVEQDLVVTAPDRRFQSNGCTVHRVDVVRGQIDLGRGDAGAAPQGLEAGVAPEILRMNFRGESAVYFSATPGSDCARLLGTARGQLIALPCGYGYSLEAVAR